MSLTNQEIQQFESVILGLPVGMRFCIRKGWLKTYGINVAGSRARLYGRHLSKNCQRLNCKKDTSISPSQGTANYKSSDNCIHYVKQ